MAYFYAIFCFSFWFLAYPQFCVRFFVPSLRFNVKWRFHDGQSERMIHSSVFAYTHREFYVFDFCNS